MLKSKWLFKENKEEVKDEIDSIVEKWKDNRPKLENNTHLYNWFTVWYSFRELRQL